MPTADEFARSLLEEAKRFYEKAGLENSDPGKSAYLHAALTLGLASLEAHINAIADDFRTRKDLPLEERAILFEREIRFEKGKFRLGTNPKFYRLEDRLQFIHRKFGGSVLSEDNKWWGKLKQAITLRNELAHPRQAPGLSMKNVENSIKSVVHILDSIYQAVYKTNYPGLALGIRSTLSF